MSLQLKPEEVSAVLKQQLADFEFKSQSYEVGTVLSIGDGIARVHGLDKTMSGELLEFAGGIMGMALNLEEDNVGVAIFGDDTKVREGDKVRRTEKIASVPVGECLRGRVLDALGIAIDGGAPIKGMKFRILEVRR